MSRGLGVLQRRALEVLRAHPEGVPQSFLRGVLLGGRNSGERNLLRAMRTLVARGLVETWLAPRNAPMNERWADDCEGYDARWQEAWADWQARSEAREPGLGCFNVGHEPSRRYRALPRQEAK